MENKIASLFNITEKETNVYDNFIKDAYYLSRQSTKLSPFFEYHLKSVEGAALNDAIKTAPITNDETVDGIIQYINKTGVTNFTIGMSGGADSAVTLALLKEAKKVNKNINIHAHTLPIHQNQAETNRAAEVCDFLGINLNTKDLSNLFQFTKTEMTENATAIQLGNIRARLRMMYLYDNARHNNGIVVSTDNFSEYLAGFWTINGDVGDLSPIQNCMKSVEVTAMGRDLGLPEHIWRATPTDGLGISDSDESQLGMTYLEWDILALRFYLIYVSLAMLDSGNKVPKEYFKSSFIEIFSDEPAIKGIIRPDDINKINLFLKRVSNTWFKRTGPIKIDVSTIKKNRIMESINSMISPL